MATPVGDSYTCVSGGKIAAGRFVVPVGGYTGVIAVSLQGSADPFAASPPASPQFYPLGLLSGGGGCKHQAWTFDSDRNEMIFGGGDTFTNSRPDFYSYNAATRQQAKIINAEDLGAETWDRSILSVSVTNGGSGYPAGGSVYYPNYTGLPSIPMTGGTGTGATCNIHTSGGVVDSCTIHGMGYGYTVGDVLTVDTSYLGGSGSGLQITVTSITAPGTPSTIISPEGRCLPGIEYDATRHVMWLEGGGPRRVWSDNLKKGGLWALDRNATPPTWHLQGPSVSESGVIPSMLYNEYSTGLFYDEVGQALYTIYLGKVCKYSLSGVAIDDVYRNNWTAFNLPFGVGTYGYPAFDTLRRRLVFVNLAESATYVWNCATDTLQKLTPTFAPVWNTWWHFDYDPVTDRVICWVAASTTGFGEPGYVALDYTGKRIHWMHSMAPDGTWTQFIPAGDKLIQDDIWYAQMSGGYDPYHKCMVILTGNQHFAEFTDEEATVPNRMTIHHLLSPALPNITNSIWTPTRDGGGNVITSDWLGLPLNTWLDVAGQAVNNVVETPHLLNNWGADSATSIAAVWCGAAWDYVNQRMYIMGGGHGDGSACEMGIYMLDSAKLQFTRVRDRDPIEQAGGWDYINNVYAAGEQWNGGNAPLLNGNPGSMHTYWGVVWIPPEVMGNTSGGLYYPGLAKAVWNFDTHAWTTTHWFNPLHDAGADWSNCASFVDGSAIYGPRANWAHFKFDLTQTEATDASATSFGKLTLQHAYADKQSNAGSAAWGLLRERRETFSFSSSGPRTRVRYGAAIDANAGVWSAYTDNITLTSSDGSHNDFTSGNLADSANLGSAGSGYDHATQTLYLMGNSVGGQLYKITGLSTNTWNVEKIAGTGALRTAAQGAYGRVRMATFAGKLFMLRVSGTTHPLQVMRIT